MKTECLPIIYIFNHFLGKLWLLPAFIVVFCLLWDLYFNKIFWYNKTFRICYYRRNTDSAVGEQNVPFSADVHYKIIEPCFPPNK